MVDESKARETSLESEIRKMREIIEQERNKSMVDEATIRRLEMELEKKLKEAKKKEDDFLKAADTIQRTENEINYLKDQLEEERRKSLADQSKI